MHQYFIFLYQYYRTTYTNPVGCEYHICKTLLLWLSPLYYLTIYIISTGPLISTQLGVNTADVGCAQLSMHSIREICGVKAPLQSEQLFASFFSNYSNISSDMLDLLWKLWRFWVSKETLCKTTAVGCFEIQITVFNFIFSK